MQRTQPEEPWDSQGTGAALGTGQPHPGRKSTTGNPQQENSRELGVTVGLPPQYALRPYPLATQGWERGRTEDMGQRSLRFRLVK